MKFTKTTKDFPVGVVYEATGDFGSIDRVWISKQVEGWKVVTFYKGQNTGKVRGFYSTLSLAKGSCLDF